MLQSFKKYKCISCQQEKQIKTNHYGSCFDYCESCSWKGIGFDSTSQSVHMFGVVQRRFECMDIPSIENEIRIEFERLNQPLSREARLTEYGNDCVVWLALSQYGFPLAYFDNQTDAENHVITFYSENMFLIRQ